MTIENLASMFAPAILRLADDDPDVEISTTEVITLTLSGFIRCHDQLFTQELLPLSQLQSAIATFAIEPIRTAPVTLQQQFPAG